MKVPCKIQAVVDAYFPYPRGRAAKAHKDQLPSGAGLDELEIYGDHSGFQQKWDSGLIPGYNRDTGNVLSPLGDTKPTE